MTAIQALTEEEAYLWAILQDESGLDLAEFIRVDDTQPDRIYRAWDFQWPWYRQDSTYVLSATARAVGKSSGLLNRVVAFPFTHPGEEMVIVAPEMNHLNPIVANVDRMLNSVRLLREMIPRQRGFLRSPHYEVFFINGARIVSRLPLKDGRGVKGLHAVAILMDECFPAGTLVLTEKGYVPIEEVSVGDLVLTHEGRWRSVTATWDRGVRESVIVKGQGHPGLQCTPDHKFFVDGSWVPASDMAGQRWNTPRVIPTTPTPDVICTTRHRKPFLTFDPVSEDFLWLVGHWVAQGSLGDHQVYWSVPNGMVDEVVLRLKRIGFSDVSVFGLQTTSKAVNVAVTARGLGEWLEDNCGRGARNKRVPGYVFGLSQDLVATFVDGLVRGDGYSFGDNSWKLTTTSRNVAFSLRTLASVVGRASSVHWSDTSKRSTQIRGMEVRNSDGFYQVVSFGNGRYRPVGAHSSSLVRRVTVGEPVHMYDLSVDEDESFVADGIVVHNSQDVPSQGWVEIFECLNYNMAGATFRAYGVSRGIRDNFYKFSSGENPDVPFVVHRWTAMHRPGWGDAERVDKVALYGGTEDHPDYKRNIYGEHGDAANPLFVLNRLMSCVRMSESAWAVEYNDDVYYQLKITDDMLEGVPIEALFNPPGSHLTQQYYSYWAGCDVGFCVDEDTEILTQRGWLTYENLRAGDLTLSINPETMKSEWVPVDGVYSEYKINIPMGGLRKKGFDALVTPEHWWVTVGESGNPRWKKTMDLNTKDRILRTVPRGDCPVEAVYSDEFVELVAWAWTEGYKEGSRYRLGQSITANPDNVSDIDRVMSKLYGQPGPMKSGPTPDPNAAQWNFSDHNGERYWRLGHLASMELDQVVDHGTRRGGRILPRVDFLMSLTRQQLDLFVDTSIRGDGWIDKSGSRKMELFSKETMDRFEMACAMAGIPTSVSILDRGERGESYHITLMQSSIATNPGVNWEMYTGVIWCPKTRYRNFLARRNGSVYYTGNTRDPTEILIFGEHSKKKDKSDWSLRLLTRVQLQRIGAEDQARIVRCVFDFYGLRLRAFGMDKTGNGLPLYQMLGERSQATDVSVAVRIKGYAYTEKRPVEIEQDEDGNDVVIEKRVMDVGADELRKLVDANPRQLELPYDKELLREWQGEQVQYIRDTGISNQIVRTYYGNSGGLHTLDAAKMMVVARNLDRIEKMLKGKRGDPVVDRFGLRT